MALGKIGAATTLGLQTGGSGTYDNIGNVTNVSGPNATADALDVTSLGDTDKKFIQGLRDGGDMTISVNYDPADSTADYGHQALTGYLDDNNTTALSWRIQYDATPTNFILFGGVVVAVSPTNSTDGLVTVDITVKVSGAITWPTG